MISSCHSFIVCVCCSLMVVLDDTGLDQKRVRERIELDSSCLHVFNNLQGQSNMW